MNYGGNTEILRKHFHDHQENFCVLLCFQSFLCAKHSFLMKVIFIQGALKNIQELLWKFQGLFKARQTMLLHLVL